MNGTARAAAKASRAQTAQPLPECPECGYPVRRADLIEHVANCSPLEGTRAHD